MSRRRAVVPPVGCSMSASITSPPTWDLVGDCLAGTGLVMGV
ncbi:hypothetical protein [Streptomyces sp. CT34]|nr:hypothetical protein [Streptomyces sp. CT34]